MPLSWLYGAFVTSHNGMLCQDFLGITYIMRPQGTLQIAGAKKTAVGSPLPGRTRHFLRRLLDVLDIIPKNTGFICVFMRFVLPIIVAGSAVGVQPLQVAARARNVFCCCPREIDDAACFLPCLPFRDLKPRGVLRARALIDARARTR